MPRHIRVHVYAVRLSTVKLASRYSNLALCCREGGRIEVTGRRGRICEQQLDESKEKRMLSFERGSTRSHSMYTSLLEEAMDLS